MCYTPEVEYETYKILYKLDPNFEATFQNCVYELVRAGNWSIAFEFIRNMVKYPNFGFN